MFIISSLRKNISGWYTAAIEQMPTPVVNAYRTVSLFVERLFVLLVKFGIASIVVLFIAAPAMLIYKYGDSEVINTWEIRAYLIWGVELVVLIVFGILRIYNAIVGNTSKMIALKQATDKNTSGLKNMDTNVSRSVGSLQKAIVKFTDIMKESKDESKRSRTGTS